MPTGIGVNEAALQEAHRAGWMEGHAAAMAERAVAAEEMAAASQAAARALTDIGDRLRGQVATTVHALSVAIARHLVEREMSQDPTLLHELVKRALALTPMNGSVTVRMHPDDLAALTAAGGLKDVPDSGIEIRWLADLDISRGGCLVDGPHGIVDGRIDRALLDIYEQLSHD
ncbi:MAG TPA: FliH/SctL family protein [Gemmatimonadales bacterium]|jgi:flagellar assembly protein FliH